MGLTVIEKVTAVPEQVLDSGVTVIKVEMGTLEPFVVVNAAILPVPDKGIRPTAAFVFTQL
jgi:hypothetical protein